MISTKSILAPISPEDGTRVSVMSRHTLNDGTTPHPDITLDKFDLWLPQLAPSPKLIGDYYKRGLSWEDFAERYTAGLRQDHVAEKVKELLQLTKRGIVTLMCIEESPELCHRRLLAKHCQELKPDLEVLIR